MYPILLSFGPVHLFSFSVFLVLSWCVFSFLFWRKLRSEAVEEQKIFDLMFFATLAAAISARLTFVFFHWYLFSGALLKIGALWVQPGLSLFGGLFVGVLTLLSLGRGAKVRAGFVLDGLALSLPWALLVGKVGSLLDGSEVGKLATLPFSIHYVGHVGPRHPVQIYEMIALLIIGFAIFFLDRKATKAKWPYGLIGVWFFLLFSPLAFVLEFFKESSVYWQVLSANQWVLIALFAEALGAFYVRGGGREKLRPVVAGISQRIGSVIKRIYAR